ncbi:MAG: hypothetical protein CL811_12585 [Colwelliaceae bacterium]|jgi:hypothetical protein|nr:hypothetical protein [Colwelliaceae bacterium]|tara:strand:+ start:1772 stop:1993 length:222 start_codon:yes stop_codon:yes gene_type:complete
MAKDSVRMWVDKDFDRFIREWQKSLKKDSGMKNRKRGPSTVHLTKRLTEKLDPVLVTSPLSEKREKRRMGFFK